MLATWRGWSWSAKLLSLWLAFSVAFFVFAKLASLCGIDLFAESSGYVRAPFSRSECL